jgi:hypothetical protein
MQGPIGSRTLTTLQLAGAALVLLGTLAAGWAADRWAPRFYVIRHQPDAYWLTAPQRPGHAGAVPVVQEHPPRFVFERTLRLDTVPDAARIRLRALREVSLSVNGEVVPLEGRRPDRWKRASDVDLAPWLREGANVVAAEVVNREGPPLLQIASDDLPGLATRSGPWSLRRAEGEQARRVRAVVAADVSRYPHGEALPRPWRALGERALPLLVVFLLCGAPAWLGLAAPRGVGGRHWPRTAFVGVALFWLALFATKSATLPNGLGFDAEEHVRYVDLLTDEMRLPAPDEAWSTFHPPLYYGAAAMLRRLFSPEPDGTLDHLLLRLLPMLSGLLAAWLAGRTARTVAPGAPGLAALAVVAAGFLPVHVLLSTFVSSEPVHTFFTAAAVCVACRLLCAERASPRGVAGLAALLGLALLTKSSTSIPIALLLPAMLALKLWWVEGRGPARGLGAGATVVAGTLLLAGWFYVRNWVLTGDPFVTNMSYGPWTYWIPPGFHTPEWFLGFGEVLRQPFFASFHSFADGLYASVWGDGYASGRVGVQYPNPWWDYDAAAAVYPLALPASAIGLLGAVRCGRHALRGENLGRRLALSTLGLVGYGFFLVLVFGSARFPFNAMPKAFYALPALVPVAVFFAYGGHWLHGLGEGTEQRVWRGVLFGYLGALCAAIAAALLG